jgi:hypothetical protein
MPSQSHKVSVWQRNTGSEVCWAKPLIRQIPQSIPFAVRISQTDVWNSSGRHKALLCPVHLLPVGKWDCLLHFQFYIFSLHSHCQLLHSPGCQQSGHWKIYSSILSFDCSGGKTDPVTFWTSSWVGNGLLFHHFHYMNYGFPADGGWWLTKIRCIYSQLQAFYK